MANPNISYKSVSNCVWIRRIGLEWQFMSMNGTWEPLANASKAALTKIASLEDDELFPEQISECFSKLFAEAKNSRSIVANLPVRLP